MKQRPYARAAKFRWPKFKEMVDWQLDSHRVVLAQRRNSRDSVVAAAVSAVLTQMLTRVAPFTEIFAMQV